ncbi:sigma-54-dependent transcriptional regulator [Thermodesulfatator atlanticus]|uniref:sigma-54-dependent transcriptional regulator n=1 Tax=Thermodesulfatator atlanticus TaxID=501497 RepID=UPI0003B42976|nr:sigma-54 dependent transcriptional regulator [Thermodesulfatator atlanticus]
MKAKILIIEDDQPQAKILGDYLRHKEYDVACALNANEGKQLLCQENFDLVILDWRLPDEDGLSLLSWIKDKFPLLQVIMLTAFATVERAVEAIKKGAYHYLTKPVNLEELTLIIDKALKELRLAREVELLKARLAELSPPEAPDIIAESPKMREILRLVSKVAQTEATVLILGESGTGKEVIANLVHRLSPRAKAPFVKVNCAAIPEGLLESELFGHERGAFTGADKSKPGLFEIADGGSIFLDEIGDLPLALQAKLLRVLQEGVIRRIGALREIKVNVRIIAATNKDLEEMVKEGLFREDLFWRLNVFSVKLPPLRERKEDILPLCRFFLAKFSQKHGKTIKDFSREALDVLLSHHFPGNVRELENIIERAVILADQDIITLDDLPPLLRGEKKEDQASILYSLPLPEAVALLESTRIKQAMEEAHGVKIKAAELLGISERVLRYKLGKYGLAPSED